MPTTPIRSLQQPYHDLIRQRLTLCKCCHRTLLRCYKHTNKLHSTILFPKARYCWTNKQKINRHLRALTFHKSTIDDHQLSLPFVQRILKSSYNSRIKISPSDLLFRNAIDLSGGIFDNIKPQESNTLSLTQSSSKMLHMQTKLNKIAKDTLEESDNKHNTENSLEPTEFLIDSFVLLHTPWRGPLRVLNSKKGEQYAVLDLTTNKVKSITLLKWDSLTLCILRTLLEKTTT